MPASRSPSRDAKPAPRSRPYWPLVLIGLAAVLAVVISAVPASIVTRFLPPEVHAEDFSGSIWHGSAGKISVNARDAGALEWRLHRAALLGMRVSADVHWVKVAFVVDAAVNIDRQGVSAHAVKGGGPIEDLRDFGIAAGWRGMADINFSELKSDLVNPLAAVGDIQVSNLTSAQIAQGADLGGYDLRLAAGAVGADGSVTAQLTDTGGPLDVKAVISLSAKERTGILTGTLRERPEAPAALRSDLEGIVQLRGRDPQGRIPVDLEFTW
jgi:type II secretion system (T2SS) protein N